MLYDLRANNILSLKIKQNLSAKVSCRAAATSQCRDTDLEIKHVCVCVRMRVAPMHQKLLLSLPFLSRHHTAAGLCIFCVVSLQHSMPGGVVK